MPLASKTPARILALCLLLTGAGPQSDLLSRSEPQQSPGLEPKLPQGKEEFFVVGYYPVYAASKYPFQDIHFEAFTHINLAFADVAADGSLKVSKNFLQKEWIDLAHKKGLRVNLSVGGWGQGYNFPQVAASTSKRKRFARTTVAYLLKHNLQGVDLDWEFPKNETQKKDFVKLGKAMRNEMDRSGRNLELSAALGANSYFLQFYELPELHQFFDYLALMTYDFHGPWTKVSGHNSPLRGSSDSWQHYWQLMQETFRQKMAEYNPLGLVDNQSKTLRHIARKEQARRLRRLRNIQRYLKLYRQAGFRVGKGLIGIPFYGRSFASKNLYSGYKKTKYITYRRIFRLEKSPKYQKKFDPISQVPYLLHKKKDFLISYDDRRSVAAKIRFARRQGLKGVIVWEITQDMLPSGRTPLQQAIAHSLRQKAKEDSSRDSKQHQAKERNTAEQTQSFSPTDRAPYQDFAHWHQKIRREWSRQWKSLLPETGMPDILQRIQLLDKPSRQNEPSS